MVFAIGPEQDFYPNIPVCNIEVPENPETFPDPPESLINRFASFLLH